MDARALILSSRIVPLSKFDWCFTQLPWLLDANLPQFVSHVPVSRVTHPFPSALRSSTLDFHSRSGTLTPAVRQRIGRLQYGSVVRLAHQPNLFAYAKLIGQFVALEALSHKLRDTTPLYYFIDYDTIGDDRFRRVSLPDPALDSGERRIQLPNVYRSHRTAVSRSAPVPNRDWLLATVGMIGEACQTYMRFKIAGDNLKSTAYVEWLTFVSPENGKKWHKMARIQRELPERNPCK
jgi:hypothetical protein